jgi:polysaccharide biosynthesis protein PelC
MAPNGEDAPMKNRIPTPRLPAILLAGLAACASTGQNYHDRNMDFGSVRTVAVMPMVNLSRDNLAGERVRDVLTSMMLATGAFYVVPHGEVARVASRAGIASPAQPGVDEVVKLGTLLKVDAILTGAVKEYGEVRSGNAAGNAISVSLQLQECATGKIVWTGTSTRGGVSWGDRMLGGGGRPMNDVTEAAVDDLIGKLFK